jgi:hypothetical protein
MQCSVCNSNLVVGSSKLVSEFDSTDVYREMRMVCINPKCPNYGGTNLNEATKYVTNRRKEN